MRYTCLIMFRNDQKVESSTNQPYPLMQVGEFNAHYVTSALMPCPRYYKPSVGARSVGGFLLSKRIGEAAGAAYTCKRVNSARPLASRWRSHCVHSVWRQVIATELATGSPNSKTSRASTGWTLYSTLRVKRWSGEMQTITLRR